MASGSGNSDSTQVAGSAGGSSGSGRQWLVGILGNAGATYNRGVLLRHEAEQEQHGTATTQHSTVSAVPAHLAEAPFSQQHSAAIRVGAPSDPLAIDQAGMWVLCQGHAAQQGFNAAAAAATSAGRGGGSSGTLTAGAPGSRVRAGRVLHGKGKGGPLSSQARCWEGIMKSRQVRCT